MALDSDIKRDVEAELKWDPVIDATDIAVAVSNGVVTLTGFVRSYAGRSEAEVVAKRVKGVVGIANDLKVRLANDSQRPDPEIARDAVAALQAELPHSSQSMKVVVKDGWITIEGNAEWHYQRTRAEDAVRRVKGVKGITNVISLRPPVAPTDIKARIQEAFRRNAEFDASHISVETSGSEVILRGTVRSWVERQEAERVAWRAPGVTDVHNRITISV
jgi:osmotically-inducible protein OsmY